MEFSRCARTGVREKIRPEDGLSKLNSARHFETPRSTFF
jgi:hypothetical protein